MKHFNMLKFDLCESANKRRIQLYADVFYHDEVEYYMGEYDYTLHATSTELELAFKAMILKGGFRVPYGTPLNRVRTKSFGTDPC